MSNLFAVSVSLSATAALPIHVAAPIVAACTLLVAWQSLERDGCARSQAAQKAVQRSRRVLEALQKR